VPLVRDQYPGGEWKTNEATEIAEATQTKRGANPKQRRIRASCFSGCPFQENASPVRAVLQRVLEASVRIDGHLVSQIGPGLLVLLGVENGDTQADAEWLAAKTAAMRIFSDEEGKMNRSVADADGNVIVVSQFTLHASTKKGNRPSFLRSAKPEISEPLYETFCELIESQLGKPVGRGVFGADMKIALVNDGPVTILIDSRAKE
jgi:D-tyrosyl-tRNA(Tyr) deacylase